MIFVFRPATKKNLDCVFEINEDGDKAYYNPNTKFGTFFTYDEDRNRKIPKAARLVHHPIIQVRRSTHLGKIKTPGIGRFQPYNIRYLG